MSHHDRIFENEKLFMKCDILFKCKITIQINKCLHIQYASLNSITTTIINIEYRIDYEFEYFYEIIVFNHLKNQYL